MVSDAFYMYVWEKAHCNGMERGRPFKKQLGRQLDEASICHN